jgi:hypothetical protein
MRSTSFLAVALCALSSTVLAAPQFPAGNFNGNGNGNGNANEGGNRNNIGSGNTFVPRDAQVGNFNGNGVRK